MPNIELNIEVVTQPEIGEDGQSLIGHVRINGVDHHVTMIPVENDDEGIQQPLEQEDRYDAICSFEDAVGFQTVDSDGEDVSRQYVTVITPFET